MGEGQSKSLNEQLRSNKRQINRSIRELDRERMQLENGEKKLIGDIKTMANKGQMSSVKIMARDLVRTRKYKAKFYEMRSQLQAVNLRLQTVKSTQAMTESMKGVTKVMVRMNKQMNLPSLNKIMQEFMKENEKMGLTEEMMSDAVDDAMADTTDEEEEERIVAQVLDEIGVDLSGQLAAAPSGQLAAAQPMAVDAQASAQPMAVGEMEKSLEDRLNNLKK
ncbi:unnamed protein product [Vitrella brassicaformis CCMP3155]|uniref:Charged multivesicular body protein 2a n=2 Tax=Vitrella brassicaformis TaxID=1169539 RepID=A0A0G4G1M1_VITBC|nr:unnamed protein product [Vitrella brassicaformis CCMP3155]|eukprot:CEM21942.1 unnamed protein product [Vitrella brassicaformis CCMP3155]